MADDFRFLEGEWQVRHRQLKRRLQGETEWSEFDGTARAWGLLDGAGSVDDNLLHAPGGTYRAASVRAYDAEAGLWSIWWVDGRAGRQVALDPPVRGSFAGGVGTFTAEDTLDGRPILVRYLWSEITATSARWEQAFSPDAGATWEVNWIMQFTRVA